MNSCNFSKFKLTGLVLSFFVPVFVFAQASQSSDIETLQRQIQRLLEQVQALQTKINNLESELGVTVTPATPINSNTTTATTTIFALPEFTRALSIGSRGDDVRKLQEYLSQDSEVYPEKLITGYFGPLTEKAVQNFQKKNKIISSGAPGITGYGIFGPQTRAKVQEIVQQGAGVSGVAPSGLLIAPGLQQTATQTSNVATATSQEPVCAKDYSTCATQKECVASGFFWYTVSCHSNPPPATSCAASYNYCSGSSECSINGYYWCRSSCYGFAEACLGETYVAPAVPATPAQPATQAIQPTTQAPTTTTSSTASAADITPPSTPTGLVASSTSSSQIYLYWSGSTDNVGIVGYKVYRNGSYIASVATVSYSDTGLSPQTSYSYTVAAYDAAGNISSQSGSVSVTTQATVAVVANPSLLSVTSLSPTSGPNGTVITLTGTGFYNANAPSYMDGLCFLYTPTACANAYAVPTSNTQIQFTVPSSTYLPVGKTYNLVLQAYANSSNLTQTFTTVAAPAASADTTAPTLLSTQITNITTSSATVLASVNEPAKIKVYYDIYTLGSADSTYYQISSYQYNIESSTYSSNPSVTLQGLTPGTIYRRVFRLTDVAGNVRDYTMYSTFTTAGNTPPPAPTGLSISNGNLTWNSNASTNATDFTGQRRLQGSANWVDACKTLGASSTSCSDSGFSSLTPGIYEYQVVACNASLCSTSNVVTITIEGSAPTTATTTTSVTQNNVASTLDSLIIILQKLQELLK